MDTIADMLTAIRNAQAAKNETVSVPYSKIKMEVAKVLARENFIKEVVHKGKKNKKTIDIVLGYDEKKNPLIKNIKKVSKLSRRVYVPLKGIRTIRQGFGMWILSTPKGVFTSKEAKKEKVGGEVICEVW
jgi:small subunit ribosomal protein S8